MPTRSREGLSRCPRCRRHVMAPGAPQDLVCPFCGLGERLQVIGRGGALAASLVAFSALGCGGGAEEPADEPTAGSETEADPGESPPEDDPEDDPGYVESDPNEGVDAYGMPPEEQPEESTLRPDDNVARPLYGLSE